MGFLASNSEKRRTIGPAQSDIALQ